MRYVGEETVEKYPVLSTPLTIAYALVNRLQAHRMLYVSGLRQQTCRLSVREGFALTVIHERNQSLAVVT